MTACASDFNALPSVAHAEATDRGWRIDAEEPSSKTSLPNDFEYSWPQRSIQRREKFQWPLARYHSQLLRGCSQPDCKTPTCLSFRKRTARGPFRPYTVLSARALAAFLASQDQPEQGLCPHLSNRPSENAEPDPRTHSDSLNGYQPQLESKLFLEPYETSKKGRGRKNPETCIGEQCDRTTDVAEEVRAKDFKSFAQVLFDTSAMKSLFSKGPIGVVSKASSPTTPLAGRCAGALGNPRTNVANQHKQSRMPATGRHTSSLTLGNRAECDNLVASEASGPSLNHGEKYNLAERKVVDASTTYLASKPNKKHSERKQDVSQGLEEAPKADAETLHEMQRLAWLSMRSWFWGGNGTFPSDIVSHDSLLSSSTTTLAYFSLWKVLSLNLTRCVTNIESDTHCMLRAFYGHTCHPLSSKPSTRGLEQQVRYRNFFRRSVSYICNTPSAMLRSFVEWKQDDGSSLIARSHPLSIISVMLGIVNYLDDSNFMLSNLWSVTGDVYMYNPNHAGEYTVARSWQDGGLPSRASLGQTLSDTEAAHIVKIVLAALIGNASDIDDTVLNAVQQLRSKGQESPGDSKSFEANHHTRVLRNMYDATLETMDIFENKLAISLAMRLAKAMDTRQWFGRISSHDQVKVPDNAANNCCRPSFMPLVVRNIADRRGLQVRVGGGEAPPSLKGGSYIPDDCPKRLMFKGQDHHSKGLRMIVEWMRTIILKGWDGKPEVPRRSAVGGALEFLRHMYIHCSRHDVPLETFHTPYISDRLEILKFPVHWARHNTDGNMVHLLRYPFLFPPATLISYFRAINHNAMTKTFQWAQVNIEMLKKVSYDDKAGNSGRGEIRLFDRLRPSISKNLVLDIRRTHIFEDAMKQLWRRKPGELMKPLKVRMGKAEGEEGVDLGGVQQEFFRLVIAEALNPKYGAFTTDATTKMSWFQPRSLEPLYRFEMVGLLASLAIYNGLTLPFTFPRALYRRMCGLPCEEIQDIEDGWPGLARGLQMLLDWSEGDVEDVFMRHYTFSVDVFGTIIDTDMHIKSERKERDTPNENRLSKTTQLDTDAALEKSGLTSKHLSESIHRADDSKDASQPSCSTEHDGPTVSTNRNSTSGPANLPTLSIASEGKVEETASSPSPNQHSPSSSSSSSDSQPMVTNANRHDFVRDYIAHLTDISIRPQLAAFLSGFRRCLNAKSLALFDPDSLKLLFEGHTVISTHDLEAVAKYDSNDEDIEDDNNNGNSNDAGYHHSHPTIRQFWEIVHEWGDRGRGGVAAAAAAAAGSSNSHGGEEQEEDGQAKVRALLEFVTASDRLPVGGVERVQFVIQKNGEGDERLPSSMTCFGRLLLPQFSGIEAMRRGLERAVQESKGFGLP